MADWTEIINKVRESQDPSLLDKLLKDELSKISQLLADSNVVYYASGFLQKPTEPGTAITREDINGFMNALHGLDCTKKLSLILHTPGGDIHAVESIVEYLHQKFDSITAIVPYLAMSGGSMICLSSDAIILGKQSQLGPTDPQIVIQNKPHSARAIKGGFDRAEKAITKDKTLAHLWAPILQSMGPSLIVEAEKALEYSKNLVSKWLKERMFLEAEDPTEMADKISDHVNADSENVYTHGQRIGITDLQKLGVNVIPLEDDQELQEAVLSAYHIMTVIFEITPSCKFIVNHNGKMWAKTIPMVQQPVIIPQPLFPPTPNGHPK